MTAWVYGPSHFGHATQLDDTEARRRPGPMQKSTSVPIMTMHLAKGREWPDLIPQINSHDRSLRRHTLCTGAIG